MPTHQTIPFEEGTFFITCTCYKWMPLIQVSDSYDLVYKWFDHLKTKGHKIIGYVIMPNHLHAVINFADTGQSINTIIGNGKRFIAYDVIKRLQEGNEIDLLKMLSKNVEARRKANKKLHEVWELSFDWKFCDSITFIQQKLNYIHNNPCTGKWNLCISAVDYIHSSAKHYLEGATGIYSIDEIEE